MEIPLFSVLIRGNQLDSVIKSHRVLKRKKKSILTIIETLNTESTIITKVMFTNSGRNVHFPASYHY